MSAPISLAQQWVKIGKHCLDKQECVEEKLYWAAMKLWDLRFSLPQVWRWQLSGIQRHVVLLKWTDVSELHTASIIRAIMKTIHTSEMLVYFNEATWCYFLESCHLQQWNWFPWLHHLPSLGDVTMETQACSLLNNKERRWISCLQNFFLPLH
jgi:hypothetical protein